MSGQSPLNMMQSRPQRLRRERPRRRRRWPFLAFPLAVVVVAIGWTWGWYYAAAIADRALSGWVEREAALGRVYACGTQTIGGFPFRILTRCDRAAATFKSNQPPFELQATDITFSAELYRPTLLHGDITGPVTLAEPGQPASLVATWLRARLSLLGVPPGDPERVTILLRQPRLDRVSGPGSGMIFRADRVAIEGRIVEGSARLNPVIEFSGSSTAAMAPTFHPLLAAPLRVEIDAVLRGFKDFSPKPWPVLFRDMQAAGGGIEIKAFRVERADAVVVGTGKLVVNADGRLDGILNVAVAGVENIVPLLGIDQLIGKGVDRLTGGSGSPNQGLSTLDRLLPGLGGIVRESTNANVIDNIKKMGEPTEIDKKPALALPLRVTDGIVSVGIIPVAIVPPLF
ncbi:MAG TPA: DUF2125 domain-containing protein [Xanthobacteraceae bacterium]|nr:DUF2125 domain-containing protein [Xanthobacteraceae bacterium]